MSTGGDNVYNSDNVVLQEVQFDNQYRMQIAGSLFLPGGLDASIANAIP